LEPFQAIAKKIDLIKVLRKYSLVGLSLLEAKNLMDALSKGEVILYNIEERNKHLLVDELKQLGVGLFGDEGIELSGKITIKLTYFDGDYADDKKLRDLLCHYTQKSLLSCMEVVDDLKLEKPFNLEVDSTQFEEVKRQLNSIKMTFTVLSASKPMGNSEEEIEFVFDFNDLGPLNPNNVKLKLRLRGKLRGKIQLVKALKFYSKVPLSLKETKELADAMQRGESISYSLAEGALDTFLNEIKKGGDVEFAIAK